MDHTRNNFDFLRMIAAWAVLVSHTWPLYGHTFPLSDLGGVAVFTFFAISGFLVFESWNRDPHAIRFLSKRLLRIFPGLIVVTLVGGIIIGPLATTLPLQTYFSDPQFIRYLKSLLLYPVDYALPGVFRENPFPVAVNGSIWTLPMEFAMYLLVCGLGATGLMRRHLAIPALVTAMAVAFAVVIRNPSGAIFTMEITELSRCAFCFFYGALLAALRGRILFVSWAWIPIVALISICHYANGQLWMILLLVPYGAISFAIHQIPYVHRAGRFGDCSYGVYIYAWLIQQSLMYWMPHISLFEFLVLATALSFALGFASWHLVEKRALRLKHLPIMRRPKTAEATPS